MNNAFSRQRWILIFKFHLEIEKVLKENPKNRACPVAPTDGTGV